MTTRKVSLNEVIIATRAGLPPSAIARQFGVSHSTVSFLQATARAHGQLPGDLPSHVLRRVVDAGALRTGGGVRQLLSGLPEDALRWLLLAVPEGGTVTELLRAIVIDAYEDEKELEHD